MSATQQATEPDLFSCLCDIGEVAGIMCDIAAREISESKPIQGTAIDMLARLIEGHVERAMNLPPMPNHATPDAAPVDGDRLRPGEIAPEDVRHVMHNLDGLALLATSLAALGREGSEIEADAVDGLRDLTRKGRDDLMAALKRAGDPEA